MTQEYIDLHPSRFRGYPPLSVWIGAPPMCEGPIPPMSKSRKIRFNSTDYGILGSSMRTEPAFWVPSGGFGTTPGRGGVL